MCKAYKTTNTIVMYKSFHFQVAHNNFGFDLKVLVNNIQQYGVNLPPNVLAFDSLKLMKIVKDEVSNGSLQRVKTHTRSPSQRTLHFSLP